jgi:hypothetical protein
MLLQGPLHSLQALGLAVTSEVWPAVSMVDIPQHGYHAVIIRSTAPRRIPQQTVADRNPLQLDELVLEDLEEVGDGPCSCTLAPFQLFLAYCCVPLVVVVMVVIFVVLVLLFIVLVLVVLIVILIVILIWQVVVDSCGTIVRLNSRRTVLPVNDAKLRIQNHNGILSVTAGQAYYMRWGHFIEWDALAADAQSVAGGSAHAPGQTCDAALPVSEEALRGAFSVIVPVVRAADVGEVGE